jgi:hypothetical protein
VYPLTRDGGAGGVVCGDIPPQTPFCVRYGGPPNAARRGFSTARTTVPLALKTMPSRAGTSALPAYMYVAGGGGEGRVVGYINPRVWFCGTVVRQTPRGRGFSPPPRGVCLADHRTAALFGVH